MHGPLQGLKLLDLSRLLPGPLLTRVFADLGADIVKVESPSAPDPVRLVPPHDGEHSRTFRALNRGKRSVALDLKTQSGRELFFELADEADAVLESFRPGVLERLGVGYEALRARRPEVILCSISGFGREGPRASQAGHDLGYQALSGVLSMSGGGEEGASHPGVQFADVAGGAMAGAFALLAAIHQRARTGLGAHLDISMTRSTMLSLVMAYGQGSESGCRIEGEDDLAGALPCYGLYRTRDGRQMALAALEPKFFTAFCERIGHPEWGALGWSRGERGEQIRTELSALFAGKDQREWIALLDDCDCCCEPVLTPEEALDDPGVGMHFELESQTRILATDLGFGPRVAPASTPALGEHTRAVASEWGVRAATLSRALADGGASE